MLRGRGFEGWSDGEGLDEEADAVAADEDGDHADAGSDASLGLFEVEAGHGGEDEDGDYDGDEGGYAEGDADHEAGEGPDGEFQVGVEEVEKGGGPGFGGAGGLLGFSVLGQISLPSSRAP